MYKNMNNVRMRWGMIAGVLANTVETVQTYGIMYKAVAQSVILYGSESWVVTGVMLKVLEGFRHQEARRIMGMTATCGAGREWKYPPVAAAPEAAGRHPIMEYTRMRQASIAEIWHAAPFMNSVSRRS